MIGVGVRLGVGRPRRAMADGPATLSPLSLSASTIAENSAPGTVVGTLLGRTAGSTLILTNDAGGHFALSGLDVVAGLVATDIETATSHTITVRETLASAANSPNDTEMTITVTDANQAASPTLDSTARRADESTTRETMSEWNALFTELAARRGFTWPI